MNEYSARLREHLLLHFTDMSRTDIPVLVRGEGCRVVDEQGRSYIDGLSGLYCTNLGHDVGDELGHAALAQMRELAFATNWTTAHPRAIELAERVTALAPPGLEHVFFTSGGSEAVEAAWKLARQWHAARGEPQRHKAIARVAAYHGTTLGALSFTGIPECRTPFEPPAIPVRFVANTNAYRHPAGADPETFCAALLTEIEDVIAFEGAETIAMLIAEPVQNAGGCLVPPPGYWTGLRELCDRHGILLCSDEVICAWGRLGTWFGAERFGYVPDLLTFAKGLTAAHVPMGGLLVHERIAAPLLSGATEYAHGVTFGGHPVGAAVALAALDIAEREDVLGNVRANEPWLAGALQELRALPLVGDVRGLGHFWAIELVRDRATREPWSGDDADWLLGEVLHDRLLANGLLCRLDDRWDPLIQIAPPLVAGRDVLEEVVAALTDALEHAGAAAADRADAAPVA